MKRIAATGRCLWVVALVCLAACTHGAGPAEHRRLAAQSTPAMWVEGSYWAFVELDARGRLVRSRTVGVTTFKADACLGEGWHAMYMMREWPEPTVAAFPSAAYKLDGRALSVAFHSEPCDVSVVYRGELTSAGFQGRAIGAPRFDEADLGAAYGTLIPAPRHDW